MCKELKTIGIAGEGATGKSGMVEQIVKDVNETLRKRGIIIAVYPGMGQDLISDIYDEYVYMDVSSLDFYDSDNHKTNTKTYIEDAIDIVSVEKGKYSVCFVDATDEILEALASFNEPYVIFYPVTPKESILKMLAQMYVANPSAGRAKTIADVILHHEERINELRLYPNSIGASTGIINEDLVNDLVSMSYEERLQVIRAFSMMKTSSKRGK